MSFTPRTPPDFIGPELSNYLEDLEQRIFEAFQSGEFERINLTKIYEIEKIADGDVINSGTDLGSGVGIYHYNGTYNKL